MELYGWLRQLARAERGASVVEYIGVTGIALMVAALIMAGLSAGRYRLGAAMASVHERQIESFANGAAGSITIDASLYPSVSLSTARLAARVPERARLSASVPEPLQLPLRIPALIWHFRL